MHVLFLFQEYFTKGLINMNSIGYLVNGEDNNTSNR
jgi:hypothetical protein